MLRSLTVGQNTDGIGPKKRSAGQKGKVEKTVTQQSRTQRHNTCLLTPTFHSAVTQKSTFHFLDLMKSYFHTNCAKVERKTPEIIQQQSAIFKIYF